MKEELQEIFPEYKLDIISKIDMNSFSPNYVITVDGDDTGIKYSPELAQDIQVSLKANEFMDKGAEFMESHVAAMCTPINEDDVKEIDNELFTILRNEIRQYINHNEKR